MSPRSVVSIDSEPESHHQLHASEEEEEEEEEAREVEDEHLREQTRGRDRHKSHHHHHHHKSRSRSASKHSPRNHSKGSKNRSSGSKHRPHHDKHHHSSSSSRKKVTQHDSLEPESSFQKSQPSPLKGKAKERAFLKNMNVPESEEEDEGEKNDSQDNNSLLNHSLQSESEGETKHASTSKSTKKKSKLSKEKKPKKRKRKTGTHGWSKMSHSHNKHVKKREVSSSPPSSSEEELEIVGEYIPEKIVDGGIRKRADGTKYHMFKVRWKGYKPKDDTWEPEEHLKDRKDLIEEYMNKTGKNRKTGVAKSKVAKPKKSIGGATSLWASA